MESAEKFSERNARYERWKVSVALIFIGPQAYGDVLVEALKMFIQEFSCEFGYFRIRFKWLRHSVCLLFRLPV
jgi:hypothetical protein